MRKLSLHKMNRRWLSITLLAAMFLSLLGHTGQGHAFSPNSIIYGTESWLQPSAQELQIDKNKQVLYFGHVEAQTHSGYTVSLIELEVLAGQEVYAYEQQATEVVDVTVRSYTDVVTTDGSRRLLPQTPVVVAGYEQPDGRVEALVIGDMEAAELVEPERNEPLMEEELKRQAAATAALATDEATDEATEGQEEKKELSAAVRVLSAQNDLINKRYATVSGDYSKSFKWNKSVPAMKVGAFLTVSLYFEAFAGFEMEWSFPFEVDARLAKSLRHVPFEESRLLPGESVSERDQRLLRNKAILEVDVKPLRQVNNRTLFAETGLRLNIGFKGTIVGHDFDVKIDILQIAGAASGVSPGLHMQVGGKYAAPAFGQSEAFGIREQIGLDRDVIDCNVISCTIDLFTDDSIGIGLPFFEAGLFSIGFLMQPVVMVYGDYPKLSGFAATEGLAVEVMYGYDQGFRNPPAPVGSESVIYPYDALLLHVTDIGATPPPQLADENGVFELSFDVDYKPQAMIGFVYQGTIKAKKLGIGGELRMPMMALPIPFSFDLSELGGGSGRASLSCSTRELTMADCTGGALSYNSASVIRQLELSGELQEAVSGAPYVSGELRLSGGAGNAVLRPEGLLPEGLRLVRTGSTLNGNGSYRLEGTPLTREGVYTVRLKATDRAGGSREFELPLGVSKIYPERIEAEVETGQLWSQQFRLVQPDGTRAADVTWQVEGQLPEAYYSLNNQGRLQTVPSRLSAGDYAFEVTVERNGTVYRTGEQHRLLVSEPDVRNERTWGVVQAEPTGMLRGYGSAVWHDQLGGLALVLPGRGAVLYDGSRFEQVAQVELPYHTSLSYVYPEVETEEGWAYLFGGARQPYYYRGDYAGDVYRWDKFGLERIYRDPKDGSGPTVFDAATAALPDGRLLVFGGDYGNFHQSGAYTPKLSDETWLFDPERGTFEQLAVTDHPSARSGKQIMTYVPEIGKVVLFGQSLNGAAFLPAEREEAIWLFDPDTLQWSKSEGSSLLTLSPDEGTQLVYSRGEQKLYVLVTETTSLTIRAQDRPATIKRLYAISTAGGELGGLIDESARLPQESEAWGRGGAGLAYDEHNGQLVYLDDVAYSRLDIWSYALPLAERDKEFLTADGDDQAEFQFHLGRYVDNPADWRIRWQSVGRASLLNGAQDVLTVPDEEGTVRLSVSYDNYRLTDIRTGSLLLVAEHIEDGRRIPVGYARIGLHPVPASTANSRVKLFPEVHDYWGDTGAFNPLATVQSELIVTLRSEGGYETGASEAAGDFKGAPLANRKLTLVNAEELEQAGLRVYTGAVTPAQMNRGEYDEYQFLAAFEGYSSSVYTDHNGQVNLTLVNVYPGRLPVGDYPIRFEVGDGSGLLVETSLSVQVRQPVPVKTSYSYEVWANAPFSMTFGLDGYEQWYSYACSNENRLSCFEVVEGRLPDGIVLDQRSGVLSGLPRETGSFEVGIKTPNQAEGAANVTLSLKVLQPLGLDLSYREWTFPAQVGDSFKYALLEKVSGGVGPFTYELIEGAFPPGIALATDESGRLTGYLEGTFEQAGDVYYAKVKITESGLNGSGTLPRSVEKTLIFRISEARSYGTAFAVFDKIRVTDTAGIWVSGLEGIPEGNSGAAFTPIGGNAYYKLIRPASTLPSPFMLVYDDYSSRYADDWLGWYYWSPNAGAWVPFTDGSYSVEGAVARVSGDTELREVWRRGTDRFMGFYEYDYVYVAVGQAVQPAPVLDEVTDEGFTDSAGNVLVQLRGAHFTEDAQIFVGARASLRSYVNYANGTGMSVWLPPGYGSKDVVVSTRGGVSNAIPFTYPGEPKRPAYDLQLKVSVKTKEEAQAADPGRWFLFDSDQVVYVDLYDASGNRVGLDDVLVKGTEACESLPEEEQSQCFDPAFTLTNWTGTFDYSTETLRFRCLPAGGSSCEEDTEYHSSPIIKGTFASDGTFRAVLRRIADLCEADCGNDNEEEEPDADYPGAEIDIVISNEDGYYGRVTGQAPAPERMNYASDATEPLRIVTSALAELRLDAPEPYGVLLQASGGRADSYEWRWGDSSSVLPGLVLERESGLLRLAGEADDPAVPDIQPGTYAVTIAVSDGMSSASRTFMLTVTGVPEREISLTGLLVHQGNLQEPLLLQGAEEQLGTSLYAAIPYETGDLYVLPFLGEYTMNGQTVTDDDYRVYTEVSVNGTALAQQPDGAYVVQPGDGWTNIRIAAMVKEGDTLLAARMYTLLVNRSQSVDLVRLDMNAPGLKETIALPLGQNEGGAVAVIPVDTRYVTVQPTAVDPTAAIRLTINGDPDSERYLTSGWESSPIELPAGETNQLIITVSGTNGSGEPLTRTYTVEVVRALSADSSLGALAFSPEVLEAPYTGQTAVELEVPYEQDRLVMIAAPSHSSAVMTVSVNDDVVSGAGGEYLLLLRPGGNEVRLLITAENGRDQSVYTVSVNRGVSNRASLAELEAAPFTLDFDPDVYAYNAAVSSRTESILLAPVPEDAGATMELFLNGARQQPEAGQFDLRLLPGANDVRLRVTAVDGVTTRQYRLLVQRAYLEPEQASPNAQLTSLQLQAGTAAQDVPLSAAFRSDLYEYTASLESGTEAVVLAADPAHPGAMVVVTRNGLPVEAVDNGRYSMAIADNEVHLVSVHVLAENGRNVEMYRVRLTVDELPADSGGEDGGDSGGDEDTGGDNNGGEDGGDSGGNEDAGSDAGGGAASAQDTAWFQELSYGSGFMLTVQGQALSAAQRPVIRIVERGVQETASQAPPEGWPDGFPVTAAYEAMASTSSNGLKADVRFVLGAGLEMLPSSYRLQAFVYNDEDRKWMPLESKVENGTLVAQSDRLGAFAVFLVRAQATAGSEGFDTSFSDTAGHWAEPWITLGAALGYVNGFEDATFRPQRSISRIEFVVMLMRAHQRGDALAPLLRETADSAEATASAEFENTAAGVLVGTGSGGVSGQLFGDWAAIPAWGAEHVILANRLGLVQGYADGTFRPLAAITRAEMVTIVARWLQLPNGPSSSLSVFEDQGEVPEWAQDAVAALVEAGIVNGRGEGKFAPLERTTRAEVIKVLVEVYLAALGNAF